MRTRTKGKYDDDVDGRPAHETVKFALDGLRYEIDLHEDNAERLRLDLSRWVSLARVVSERPQRRRFSEAQRNQEHLEELTRMRWWGRENGFAVSSHGRIPNEVKAAYMKAQQQ